jgi:HPt (histidine-containing phosphotransfer) domain-containing protein
MVIQMERTTRTRQTAAEKLERQMQLLWQEHRAEFADRVDTIESARTSLVQGMALSFVERAEAASSAHKLAGVLGIFGLKEGTEAARKIETLLTADEAPPAEYLTRQLEPHISALRAAIASR